jgi:thioredoxin-like negative regulator of GroEL
MSQGSRRSKIEAMLEAEPQDQFLRYSLAHELFGEDQFEAGLELLGGLQRDPQPYVPAFFKAAQQLVQLDRLSEARGLLREGIDQARAQQDLHAAAEMSEFLSQLGELGP